MRGSSLTDSALSLQGVSMRFGGTLALDAATFSVERGHIHGLLGANGAGKSTAIKIVEGVFRQTSGELKLMGKSYSPRSVSDAICAGVRVAPQEVNVVPRLTVRENILLGRRLRRGESIDDYTRLFAEWGLAIDMDRVMQDLSPALQASVYLAKALVPGGDLIMLDEPTASLGPHEVEGLFKILRRRVQEGAGVIFVSHRLNEVARICDAVTVLRNGRVTYSDTVNSVRPEELVELIAPASRQRAEPLQARIGEGGLASRVPREEQGKALLSLTDVTAANGVRGVTFDLRVGEILGIAGLVGAGRTELMHVLAGVTPMSSGTIRLDGQFYAPRDVYAAKRHGVMLVPEERKAQAIFGPEDIAFNSTAAAFREMGAGPRKFVALRRRYMKRAAENAERLQLKAESLTQGIGSLSGGNQQKVVLGRVLVTGLRVLLLDEPTRGVDVGARREFQTMARELADSGIGVIYVSSELTELSVCDRIVVMVGGRSTEILDRDWRFDEDDLTRRCFGNVGIAR